MMPFWEILLVAFALAMDCFTVSVIGGVLLRRFRLGIFVRMAFLFGFFQAMMPLLGWLALHHFQAGVAAFDHWIAFGLLTFIGLKMIRDGFRPDGAAPAFDPARLPVQLVLAVATSIDALAVGLSLACTGYTAASQLGSPLLVIGVVSFGMSLAGSGLGVRYGNIINRRWKPEWLGGVILILIGVKILLEHLLG